jgi:dihydroxyacetone kinase
MLGLEPRLRLGDVAGGGTGEHEPRHAVGEPARDDAADRTETGYGNASH